VMDSNKYVYLFVVVIVIGLSTVKVKRDVNRCAKNMCLYT
jgi:hypothetical protein